MKKTTIALLCAGGLLGAGVFFAGQKIFQHTSTNEFCVSCHTMQKPLEEYQGSVHFSNKLGIRADCADCHIPQDSKGYLLTKIGAGKDVYHQFVTKKIDTPEQFETHRQEMAEKVWADMRANDSQTCRTCHHDEAAEAYQQSLDAQKMHQYGKDNGQTCIDCHKGVAHFAPEIKVDSDALAHLTQLSANTPKEAEILYPVQSFKAGNLATVYSATPLHLVKADDNARLVEVRGVQMQGAEQVIYFAQGQRIILATLTEEGKTLINQQNHAFEKDSYGNAWREVVLSFELKDEAVLDNQQLLWAYAEKLDNAYCSICHAQIPAEHFTVNAWPNIAKSMGDRTAITPEELEILTKYFQFNAKDFKAHEGKL